MDIIHGYLFYFAALGVICLTLLLRDRWNLGHDTMTTSNCSNCHMLLRQPSNLPPDSMSLYVFLTPGSTSSNRLGYGLMDLRLSIFFG